MTKTFKVNITRNAQSDLEHIFSYIAADSANNATRFLLELEKQIYSLETLPKRFSYIPENVYFGTDYRHLIHKKYRVIYRIDKSTIFILRIIHGAKLLDL